MKAVKNPTIEDVKAIVDSASMNRFKWVDGSLTLDTFTASAIKAVYNASSPDNQAKMNEFINASKAKFIKVANFSFKCIK